MKSKKWIKITIASLCMISMALRPMGAFAVEVLPSETEESTETEICTETVSDDADEEQLTEEVSSEEEISEVETTETETSTEDEIVNGAKTKAIKKSLNASAPIDGEIDIADYSTGLVINNDNFAEYNGKTITGTATSQANIVIAGGVDVELTIKDLTVDRVQSDNARCDAILIRDASTLRLTLEGENRLVGNDNYGGAGICVENNNKLIITENSSGTLEAVGGSGQGGAAGIGAGSCGYHYNGNSPDRRPVLGTIEICGGTIKAWGSSTNLDLFGTKIGSAGIGCSALGESDEGLITISGGNVTANGGDEGAGIGGASNCAPKKITITGGKITANAGRDAAAIGSGYNAGVTKIGCGDILITGGEITANGNIGYGNTLGANKFEGGSIAIAGKAIVTVKDGEINPRTDVAPGHVTQKYPITVTVKNPSYTNGTKNGHITVGEGENAFSEDITFNLEDGKAVANIEIETILYGEQPVKLSIEGTEFEEKILVIGTENDLVYGSEEQDFTVSASDDIECRYANGVLTIGGNGNVTVAMADGVEQTTDSIVVDDNADVNLTIKNLTVDTTGKNRSPIVIGKNSSATCKIIAVGKNTLTRCDDELAVGVIEASDRSNLTIGGTGNIYVKGKSGKEDGKNKSELCAGGIWALNASVTIEDNPVLKISNPGGNRFSGILSKDITINGGRINSSVDDSSQGIGIPYDESTSYDVKITGGTIYAKGGEGAAWLGAIVNKYCQRAVISGGSVNMNKCMENEPKHPVNEDGKLLYCTQITVGSANDNGKYTMSANAQVKELTIKDSTGSDYQYGIGGMYTDADAKLYLWLPENAKVSKVVTESGTYEGECVTNATPTANYKGNSFGTAAAEFALAEGSEYRIVLAGDGTKENPYELNSLEELEKFRDMVNSGETTICGILTKTIDTNSKEWTPIGTEEHPYQGTFDGNGKRLLRVKISAKDSDYDNKGLFGVVQNAHIKNLELMGSVGEDAKTNRNAVNYGMFAGKASNSTFESCINSGSVYGGQNAAGICGWASQCTFKKCTNNGDGETISSYKSVCGIVYDGDGSCKVENCMNSIYTNSKFGKMDSSVTMSDCYTIGGKYRTNCLSLVAQYDLYEFVEEDANYYGHKRSNDENYSGYKADGTKVTDNWRDGKIAYLLQGDQKELVWTNIIDSNKSYWPKLNYTSNDAPYRVYAVKTYTKCDKSDVPTVTYQNEIGGESVPTHSFTVEDKSAKALKMPGTCKNKAVYYYTCEHCGAVEKDDTHTFEGTTNPSNHVGETEVRDAREAVHNTQTDGYTGDTYCLDCGAKISTGSTIKPSPHIPSQWQHDESHHWKICTVEGCGIEIEGSRAEHSSTGNNKATCQKVAVCDKCGVEYGTAIPCSFTAKVKSEAALMTPATATTDAVYYYSCSMCGAVEGDAEHTFVDHHQSKTKPSPDKGSASRRDSASDNDSASGDDSSSNENSASDDNTTANNVSVLKDVVKATAPMKATREVLSKRSATPDRTVANANVPEVDTDLDDNGDEQAVDEVVQSQIDIEADAKANGGVIVGAEVTDGSRAIIDDGTATAKKEAARRRLAVATSAVVVSGATAGGAYFFLKRNRLLEKILKHLFKK